MTEKEAIADLKSYLHNLLYLKQKEDDIKEFRCKIEKTTKVLSDMPHAKGFRSSLEDQIAKLIELEDEHREIFIFINQKRLQIEKKISQIPQPKRNVLYLRYIKGYTVEKIAELMNYSYIQIIRIHKEAISDYIKTKDDTQ